MASGHMNRVKRPDTWLHRPMLQNVKKVLANPEPSTHGTKRTSSDVRLGSALRGKADSMCSERVFPGLTRSGSRNLYAFVQFSALTMISSRWRLVFRTQFEQPVV